MPCLMLWPSPSSCTLPPRYREAGEWAGDYPSIPWGAVGPLQLIGIVLGWGLPPPAAPTVPRPSLPGEPKQAPLGTARGDDRRGDASASCAEGLSLAGPGPVAGQCLREGPGDGDPARAPDRGGTPAARGGAPARAPDRGGDPAAEGEPPARDPARAPDRCGDPAAESETP